MVHWRPPLCATPTAHHGRRGLFSEGGTGRGAAIGLASVPPIVGEIRANAASILTQQLWVTRMATGPDGFGFSTPTR
jgi:hypothetical protein